MGLIDVLEELSEFGLFTVLLIFCLMVLGIIFAVKTFKEASGLFGKSHRQLLDENVEERLSELETKIADLEKIEQRLSSEETKTTNLETRTESLEASAKKFNDDRTHDREQSQGYQNQWMEVVHEMSAKQDALIEEVKALAEQNRKYQLADIRETLLQAYRYYTSDSTNPSKKWTEIEASAFWEQYDTYKEHGGNGYMESEVKPAMNRLTVVQLDDYDQMAELMTSRSHHKN